MGYFSGVPWKYDQSAEYILGTAGVGGYTTKADTHGYYFSFFLRPEGKGSRSGNPEKYLYVPRSEGKRKSRKASRIRAERLANGERLTQPKPKPVRLPDTAWCTKERKTVSVKWEEMTTTESGRTMIHGACEFCGHAVQRFGKIIDCPSCGQTREARSDDYICRSCREETDR